MRRVLPVLTYAGFLLALGGLILLLVGWIATAGPESQVPDAMRDSGARLLVGGSLLFGVAGGPRWLSFRRVFILSAGLWPFLAFFSFLHWQIGLSGEQAARCARGEAQACLDLGSRRLRRGHAEDARTHFAAGCALDLPSACTQWAAALRYGQGGPADLSAAMEAYRRACAAGDAFACSEGGRLAAGTPALLVEQEELRALFAAGCRGGIANACVELDALPQHRTP